MYLFEDAARFAMQNGKHAMARQPVTIGSDHILSQAQ